MMAQLIMMIQMMLTQWMMIHVANSVDDYPDDIDQ